jgi:hypothetical protein
LKPPARFVFPAISIGCPPFFGHPKGREACVMFTPIYIHLPSFTTMSGAIESMIMVIQQSQNPMIPDDPRWSLRTRITTDDIGDHFFVHVPNLGGKNIPLIFTIMNICIYIWSSKHLNAINYTSNNIPWWWFELFVFFQCWLDDDDPNPNWLSIFVQGVAKKQQQ